MKESASGLPCLDRSKSTYNDNLDYLRVRSETGRAIFAELEALSVRTQGYNTVPIYTPMSTCCVFFFDTYLVASVQCEHGSLPVLRQPDVMGVGTGVTGGRQIERSVGFEAAQSAIPIWFVRL